MRGILNSCIKSWSNTRLSFRLLFFIYTSLLWNAFRFVSRQSFWQSYVFILQWDRCQHLAIMRKLLQFSLGDAPWFDKSWTATSTFSREQKNELERETDPPAGYFIFPKSNSFEEYEKHSSRIAQINPSMVQKFKTSHRLYVKQNASIFHLFWMRKFFIKRQQFIFYFIVSNIVRRRIKYVLTSWKIQK